MDDPFQRPSVGAALFYRDPVAALAWLERAFGFTRTMVITDTAGQMVHAELKVGDGYVMIGAEWADHVASPASTGGRNTQTVHVRLNEDIDAHCARAQTAEARIVRPLTDEFYGDRVYQAGDLEGHVWSFGQPKRIVTREEAERESGLKITGWPAMSART